MTDTNAMEPEALQDAAAAAAPLDERIAQARARLHELAQDLSAVDAELDNLIGDRVRQHLLERACTALDELDEAYGAELFWDGLAGKNERAEHIARARGRAASLRARIDAVESRRSLLVQGISEHNEQLLLLEDEAFEHQEEVERQHNEWVVERELQTSRARPHLMLWMRGEEDRRSRKGLAIALCVWLVIAIVLPFISIPEQLAQPEKLPERVVTVIPEAKKLEKAPPPPPELTRPEKRTERKPTPTRTDTAKAEPRPVPTPQAPKPQGILAFKDALTAVDDLPAVAELGHAAKLSNDTGEARPERAMLTGSTPGRSSGINLAAQSRGFGSGSGERGAIKGTALTRAASGINAVAANANSAAGGSAKRGGRSDEEIQVVFDRHKSALYRLYQRELRNDATLQGKVVLRLTIEPDGSVSMAQLKSSEMEAPALIADILARVKGFNFGAKDVPAVTIVYPMNFLPAG
jgi:outer membrane biosynthesis protein TonB